MGNLIGHIFCCITIRQEMKCLWGVLHICNYVSNCLLEIIFCGCLWESKYLWDILECISDSYYASCGHVTMHTHVGVKIRTNIPNRCAMMAPWCLVARVVMYYHVGTRWCHRRFIKIIWTKKVFICWESWVHHEISKEIQGDCALRE